MRKKLTALALAFLLIVTASGCGGQSSAGGSESASGSGVGSSQITQTPAGSGQDQTSSADGSMSAEQPDSSQPETPSTDGAASKPETSKPSGGTASKPETSKPSGGSSASVDLSAFYATLSADPDFPSMSALTGDALDSFYSGLNDLKPKQALVYLPMISAVACEIALVEVSDSADVKTVKDIFQSRIDYQIEQGAFYPATVEAWENQAQIVSNGNYVMLVCMDGGDTVVSSFNALFQ